MKSSGNADFWRLYHGLPAQVKAQARHAFQLFRTNSDHPSLLFGGNYRAVGQRDGDSAVWLWVGTRQDFGKRF